MTGVTEPAVTAPARLDWLDALRAVAALAVLYSHLGKQFGLGFEAVLTVIEPGYAGVLLFFLVSGYLIPEAVERTGDAGRFWVRRFFRLYPAYVLAIGVALGSIALGWYPSVDADVDTAAAHATMLTILLHEPMLVPVFWTLAFELVWYLIATALHVTGQQRRVGALALTLAFLALLTSVYGWWSVRLLREGWALALVVIIPLLVLAARSARAAVRIPAAVAMAGLALLLATQWYVGISNGLVLVALLLLGALIRRAERAGWPLLDRLRVAGTAVVIVAAALLHAAYGQAWHVSTVAGCLAFAGGAFAQAMWLRGWAFPRALIWLGTVSYSLYLLHYLVVEAAAHLTGSAVVSLLASIAVAAGAYYAVEAPGQRLGRRLTAAPRSRAVR